MIDIVSSTSEPILSVRKLAKMISSRETGTCVAHATGEPYRNVYNALSQTHLPTLAEADIIIYDAQRQTVRPGPNLPLAELLLAISRPTVTTFHNMLSDE
uniref:DUF7344 domain-containing protein n=1 Tax=Haladaptatus cibarius TaxID=453847 RepID=UPI000679DDA4|nr:hypothetical protein [Haladaptatus cibarius]